MKKCNPHVAKILLSFYPLIPVLIGLDQLTKWLAYLNNVNIWIIPNFFGFYYTRNTGAAWSLFENNLLALAFVSLIAGITMLVYRIIVRKKLTVAARAVWAVIIAGTWGNFIDRAFYEEGVIDFIAFKFGDYQFPIFNFADMCLTLGAIALMILMLIEKDMVLKEKIPLVQEALSNQEVEPPLPDDQSKEE